MLQFVFMAGILTMMQPREEIPELEGLPPAPYTVEQVRSALESISTNWVDREIEYVLLPLREPDAPPDHPNRSQRTWRQSQTGMNLLDGYFYQNNKRVTRTYIAWDHKREIVASFANPLPEDLNLIKPTSARVGGPQQHYTYPFPLNLEFARRPLYEWLSLPEANIAGLCDVDGHECVRVTSVLPTGLDVLGKIQDGKRLMVLDVDPKLGFWPRRTHYLTYPEMDRYIERAHFSEFKDVGGRLFPHKVTRGPEDRKNVFLILKVSCDQNFDELAFQLELPEGIRVRNDSERKMYYLGGKKAVLKRLQEARAKVHANGSQDGTPVDANSASPRPWLQWALFAIGFAFLLLGVVWLKRQKHFK